MNQSSYIAAALIAGFVLYVAAQDRLKTYAAVLWGNTKAASPAQSSSASNVGPIAPAASSGGITSDPTSFSNDSAITGEAAQLLLEAYL